MLELLLFELVLDVGTERHWTLLLLTVLGVVAAEGDELFAYGTATVGLPLAVLGVLDDELHLLAGRQTAIGIATLARVHQGLDASLNGLFARLLRIRLFEIGRRRAIVQIESQFLHLVRMSNLLLAHRTEIKILQTNRIEIIKSVAGPDLNYV